MLRAFAGLLLAAALLAACAEPDAGDGGAASGGGPTTTAGPPPTAPPTTAPGSTGGGQVTVTGTVHAGVEPGCLLLHADRGTVYLLVGGDRGKLRAGGRVQVRGRTAPDLLSTCQQGEPLQVASIRPAP